MATIKEFFAVLNLLIRNGNKLTAGNKFETAVLNAFRLDGHEVKTNKDLQTEGFWKKHGIRYGKAIDGAVKFQTEEFWTPIQIKYTWKDQLSKVNGKFYECLPEMLRAFSAPRAIIATNAEYESENEFVTSLCGQTLIDLLNKYPQSFNGIFQDIQIPVKPFRQEQVNIIAKIKQHFETKNRGTIILPCGYGKTMISIGAASSAMKVLILVPTLLLVEQAVKDWISVFPELWSNIYKFANDSGNIQVRIHQLKNWLIGRNRYVVVSTYHSGNVLESIEFNLAIFDECHRTVGLKDKMFGYLITHGNIAKRLFLTATPLIVDENKSNQQKVLDMRDISQYGQFIVNKGIKEGIEDLILSPYEVICFARQPETSYESGFVNILEQSIVDGFSRKIIVFAHKNEQLVCLEKILTDLYPERHVLRTPEGSTRKEQRVIAEKFTNSIEPVILLNCSVYLEGFDVPGCDSVAFYQGTKSIVRIIQGIGRALRLDPTNPKKIARVLIPFVLFPEDVQGIPNVEITDIIDILKAVYHSDEGIVGKIRIVSLQQVKGSKTIVPETINIPDNVREKVLIQIIQGIRPSEYSTLEREVRRARLRNEFEYNSIREERGWPDSPDKKFENFSWVKFLGHRKEDFWDYETTRTEFQNYYRQHKDIIKAWNIMKQTEVNVPWYFERIYQKELSSMVSNYFI